MSKSSTRNKIDVLKSWMLTLKTPKKKIKLSAEQLYEDLNKNKLV
jgi:hypothetical protein